MTRRPRRETDDKEFADPLGDYQRAEYADVFEQLLCESAVGEMEIQPCLMVEPGTAVGEVLRRMDQRQLYCALVVEEERLVGVFSERDALMRVGSASELLCDQPIRACMTLDPVTVYATDSPAKAINLMATGGFRHVPVLDLSERPIGVLGPRRVVSWLWRVLSDQ